MFNILIVDDDKAIVDSLAIYLSAEGYNVLKCYDGMSALETVAEKQVHLIIMDVMMPRMDGIRATMRLRETHNIPIIIMSAKSEDADKILGLNIGADDYVTKPFNPLELVARVKSQLRRYSVLGSMEKKEGVIQNGTLELDTERKQLWVSGTSVRLTATEYGIVELLMRNAGRVFSIDEIYQRVWNEPSYNPENTVAVHIRRIREKIEINPREPEYLKVVWGIGYKIEKI
ncbi:MAG: response regulator transcription factor [Oscillospiraceae bacterium]|nr:response regulator transcription factor [Oscillospiraceae bacterium]